MDTKLWPCLHLNLMLVLVKLTTGKIVLNKIPINTSCILSHCRHLISWTCFRSILWLSSASSWQRRQLYNLLQHGAWKSTAEELAQNDFLMALFVSNVDDNFKWVYRVLKLTLSWGPWRGKMGIGIQATLGLGFGHWEWEKC